MNSEPARIELNEKWCKGCGICIAFCPAKVLVAREDGKPLVENPEAFTRCCLFDLRCPDLAISVGGKQHGSKN